MERLITYMHALCRLEKKGIIYLATAQRRSSFPPASTLSFYPWMIRIYWSVRLKCRGHKDFTFTFSWSSIICSIFWNMETKVDHGTAFNYMPNFLRYGNQSRHGTQIKKIKWHACISFVSPRSVNKWVFSIFLN